MKIEHVTLDNRWIVPCNLALLRKYNAHIKVKICNRIKVIKYLYKYIHKGEGRATMVIAKNVHKPSGKNNGEHNVVDEITQYLYCRYIFAPESSWRIFDFKIQDKHQSVERLQFHLKDQQVVLFRDESN